MGHVKKIQVLRMFMRMHRIVQKIAIAGMVFATMGNADELSGMRTSPRAPKIATAEMARVNIHPILIIPMPLPILRPYQKRHAMTYKSNIRRAPAWYASRIVWSHTAGTAPVNHGMVKMVRAAQATARAEMGSVTMGNLTILLVMRRVRAWTISLQTITPATPAFTDRIVPAIFMMIPRVNFDAS
jgi:hypothetical protein